MKRLVIPAILAAALLGLAACSDDASPTSAPGTTASTEAVSTTATTQAPPATTEGTTATTAPATTTTSTSTTTTTLPPLQGLTTELVGEGFDTPVFVTSPPGDGRLFVVEKPGRIRIIGGDAEDDSFLDLRPLVGDSAGEQGLLGLAFHPDYAGNGRFFVHYTDNAGDTTLAAYRVSDDPDRADPDSAEILLTADQPAGNHNGGMIAFGPDGYLYMALGDGGGGGDRYGNGQRPDTLLGTLLRLDVDSTGPYAIPPGNPFADGGGAPEVWAYGLRNPWRFSFDDGWIYIGDVGQNAWEEVDVAPADAAGLNYGWPITEGEVCYQTAGCDTGGLTPPVLVYPHDRGCSVTGGYVYRGAAIPELDGHYFYADFCKGWVRSFRYEDGAATDRAFWGEDLGLFSGLASFGRDASGEIYIVDYNGRILRIVPVR